MYCSYYSFNTKYTHPKNFPTAAPLQTCSKPAESMYFSPKAQFLYAYDITPLFIIHKQLILTTFHQIRCFRACTIICQDTHTCIASVHSILQFAPVFIIWLRKMNCVNTFKLIAQHASWLTQNMLTLMTTLIERHYRHVKNNIIWAVEYLYRLFNGGWQSSCNSYIFFSVFQNRSFYISFET